MTFLIFFGLVITMSTVIILGGFQSNRKGELHPTQGAFTGPPVGSSTSFAPRLEDLDDPAQILTQE